MRKIKSNDGWEIHEILDPTTKERKNKYFYKRKRAPSVHLKDKVSQQLAGYSLIEKDLRNVLIWLDEIDKKHTLDHSKGSQISPDRETYNIIKALYVAALTFYGKCFTSCEGRKVKLDIKLIDDEYVETHKDIMHMRHNFAAHSGADSFEECKISLVLYPNKRINEKPFLQREIMQIDLSIDEENSFRSLTKHIQTKVLIKIGKLEKRIFEKEILVKGKDYWYKKAKI